MLFTPSGLTAQEDPNAKIQSSLPDDCTTGRVSMFKDCVGLVSPMRKHNRIIDVGSGQGFFLHLCSKQGWRVWGVEINRELAEGTQRNYGIEVFLGDLEQARYPSDSFDVVTFWNVLDHLVDPRRTLKEAFRILRPGGAVFLRFPNGAFHVASRWVFSRIYKFWRKVKAFDHSVIHRYSFSRSIILSYLQKTGFEDIMVQDASPRWAEEDSKEFPFQKTMGSFVKSLSETVRLVSRGRWFISPSLLVRATKP
jgi:ubiquinone/menaquinone biosynthesis C-methylase UbiE